VKHVTATVVLRGVDHFGYPRRRAVADNQEICAIVAGALL
jgi:hypothetical protein